MQLHSLVIDDFLSDFDGVRKWADGAEFRDVVNPVDGVTYPAICADIPTDIMDQVRHKLRAILGGPVEIKTIFARLSQKGVEAPHQAHNDASMGDLSVMVYLTRDDDVPARSGTELVEHITHGMEYGPTCEEDQDVWQEDTNDPAMWSVVSRCPMKANRAFIFNSALMHRAAPIGGFGHDQRDGRLVLTAFVDLV